MISLSVDCVIGQWSAFSACSVACGGDGTKTRSRAPEVEAANGGTECTESLTESATCNNGDCNAPG